MAINYEKPLKAKFEIEGVTTDFELKCAGEILLKIYNLACNIANDGGVERFNSEWDALHPNWDYKDEERQEEYIGAYERYFKSVADDISNQIRTNGVTYKLREAEPVLINFDQGYFTVYGYKEAL